MSNTTRISEYYTSYYRLDHKTNSIYNHGCIYH